MKTASSTSTTAYLRSLNQRIAAVRRKRSSVRMTTGIASCIGMLVGTIVVECALDELVELPWIARAFILLAILAGSGWLLWRDSIEPFLKKPHDDAIALMIENALPVFRTRFIASIQLARVYKNEQPVLVRALLAETSAAALRENFGKVIKTKRMNRSIKIAIAVLLVAGGLGWYSGTAGVLLLKRAFLFNIHLPRKTQILNVSGDKKIGIGEDCNIDVTASGILPSKGVVVTTSPKGDIREFELVQTAGKKGQYSASIKAPQDSFTYRVKLNDDTSDTYHVTTMQRPAVVGVNCEQTYPSYVKLPPVKRNPGDLTLLAGSKLRVTAKASMPVKKATIKLVGVNKEIAMQIDPKTQQDIAGQFDIPTANLTGFSLQLTSTEGVESANTAVYRIDLVPDHEPTVKVLWPQRREELATSGVKFLVAFEAKDDFGITKAELHFTLDNGPEQKPIPFEIGANDQTIIKRHFDWEINKFFPKLGPGNVIEYWLTVQDTNTVTGPGIGTTDHYQIKIVTVDEKKTDIDNHRMEVLSGVSEVKTGQEGATNDIGTEIFQKPK